MTDTPPAAGRADETRPTAPNTQIDLTTLPPPDVPLGPNQTVTERPHPLTPLARSWMALVAIVIFSGRSFFEDGAQFDLQSIGPLGIMAGIWLLFAVVHGYFDWRFTRFVINDEQVRIDRRFINHTSERISFTKIQSVDVVQPFAARMLGLAKLVIDVGNATDRKEIEFLSRSRATKLRNYLMARAHGQRVSVDATEETPAAFDADLNRDDEIVVRATPGRLILAAITKLSFIIGAVILIVVLVGGAVAKFLGPALGGTFAIALVLFNIVSDSVLKQWNYTLSRSDSGVRVARGMTSLTSQSVPVDRIQGISIEQGIIWRPLGLYRVEMTVLGSKLFGGDATDSHVLVPAGRMDEVRAALRAVWPSLDLDAIEMHPAPRRARWLHPIQWKTLTWGYDDSVVVSQGGVFDRSIVIVPHARVQSVELAQGPLRRRLGLATTSVHITTGPVAWEAKAIDQATAREFVLSEMDRCRTARRRGIESGTWL